VNLKILGELKDVRLVKVGCSVAREGRAEQVCNEISKCLENDDHCRILFELSPHPESTTPIFQLEKEGTLKNDSTQQSSKQSNKYSSP
jgi:hypothetical protein